MIETVAMVPSERSMRDRKLLSFITLYRMIWGLISMAFWDSFMG